MDNDLQPDGPAAQSGRNARRSGDDDLSALASKNRSDRLSGDALSGEEANADLLQVALHVGKKRCGDKVGVDDGRKDIGRLVDVTQLRLEGLVESQRRGLGRAVVGVAGQASKGCNGRDGDNVAVVLGYHAGQELLDHEPVGHGVDGEDLLQRLLVNVEDAVGHGNAGIVVEDRRLAKVGADAGGSSSDGLLAGHVALVEAHVGLALQLLGQRLDVKHCHLDALAQQLVRDAQADAAAAARHDGNLLGPVPAGSSAPAPRVGRHLAQLAVDGADRAEADQHLQGELDAAQVMVGREVNALEERVQRLLGRLLKESVGSARDEGVEGEVDGAVDGLAEDGIVESVEERHGSLADVRLCRVMKRGRMRNWIDGGRSKF